MNQRTLAGPAMLAVAQQSTALRAGLQVGLAIMLALGIYVALNQTFVLYALGGFSTRGVLVSLVLCFVVVAGFTGTMFWALRTTWWVRLPLMFLMVASATTHYALLKINKSELTLSMVTWLLAELDQTGHAFEEFAQPIAVALLWCSLAMAGMLVLSGWVARREPLLLTTSARGWLKPWSAGLFVLAASASLFLPTFVPADTGLYGLAARTLLFASVPAPRAVSQGPQQAPRVSKIVMVIDESLIPGPHVNAAVSPMGAGVIDYGVAWSSGSCSAASNALLRWGVDAKEVGTVHDPREHPPLWAMAKAAGFRTVLIDAQRAIHRPQNFMRAAELAQIDEVMPMDSGLDSDVHAADALARILERPEPSFVYIVKRGVHFPYAHNLPEAVAAQYNGDRMGGYLAAVSYTTGRFFERLARERPGLKDTLLLYTSDHGQLMEGGPTHCRYDPAALAQWRVPMLAMGEGVARVPGLVANAPCWKDAASHQNLRAAALEAMGYDDHSAQPGGFASLSRCDRPAAVPLFVGALPFPTAAHEALRFKWMPLPPAGTP